MSQPGVYSAPTGVAAVDAAGAGGACWAVASGTGRRRQAVTNAVNAAALTVVPTAAASTMRRMPHAPLAWELTIALIVGYPVDFPCARPRPSWRGRPLVGHQ
jgi:hypothetical protein